MAFASSSLTVPRSGLAIQSDPSSSDPGSEFGCGSSIRAEQNRNPTSTRHGRHDERYENNVRPPSPLRSPQSSSHTVYGAATPMATRLNFPSSPSILDASYDRSDVPHHIAEQKRNHTFSRHARHNEGDDNLVSPSPSRSPRSSFQTVYGVATPMDNGEPYPSSAPYSPAESQSKLNLKEEKQRPNLPLPVTDNNFSASMISISKTAAASSHSKQHFVLPSILKLKRLNPALVLQNSGSVARDHLASERTFLAYVRTSLGLASAGVGIVQLFTITELTAKSSGIPLLGANRRVQRFAMPLGILTLVFSLCVLFLGVYRYFVVQHALPKNMFPAARLTIVFTSFVFGALVAVTFGALLNEKVGMAVA